MKLTAGLVEYLIRKKEYLKKSLEAKMDRNSIKRAEKDSHAKREPRACGLTIHTGIGCSFGCVYCYIVDMGFKGPPRPYPLTGNELVYALLENPYFIPGSWGTLLAFGSVTEPFMDVAKSRTYEYMSIIAKLLGNPLQVSTKAYLSKEDANKIKNIDPYISVLVTIISLRQHSRLEPGAPNPQKRFETISNLSKNNIHVSLFLRPIIPGVTDKELVEIIRMAKEHGAKAIIPGSLRVTPRILYALEQVGVDIRGIRSRMTRLPRSQRDQVVIRENDLKMYAVREALKLGLKPLPSSCAANIEAHKQACQACGWGPCGNPARLPDINPLDIKEVAEILGFKTVKLDISGNTISITVSRTSRNTRILYHWVKTLSRRNIIIRYAL